MTETSRVLFVFYPFKNLKQKIQKPQNFQHECKQLIPTLYLVQKHGC